MMAWRGGPQKRPDRHPEPPAGEHRRHGETRVGLGAIKSALSTNLCARRGWAVLQSVGEQLGEGSSGSSTASLQLRPLGGVQRDAAYRPVSHADSLLVLPLMCWSCKSWPGQTPRGARFGGLPSPPISGICARLRCYIEH
jgi:hypothetical protein